MKTILDVLKEYKVEIDSDCNNLENIDVVRTHVDTGLYFVYKLLSSYKHMYKLLSSYKHMDKNQEFDLRREVLSVGIEAERIACKLLNNYIRLRLIDLLTTKDKLSPYMVIALDELKLENTDIACSSVANKILDKIRELVIEFKSRAVYRETIITPEYFVSRGGSLSIERLVNDCEIIVEECYRNKI